MNTALYLRTSTADQTTDNQQLDLEKVADKMDWAVTEVFKDVISGAKAKRPGLDALMKAVTRKEVDMVMVWGPELRQIRLNYLQNSVNRKGTTTSCIAV